MQVAVPGLVARQVERQYACAVRDAYAEGPSRGSDARIKLTGGKVKGGDAHIVEANLHERVSRGLDGVGIAVVEDRVLGAFCSGGWGGGQLTSPVSLVSLSLLIYYYYKREMDLDSTIGAYPAQAPPRSSIQEPGAGSAGSRCRMRRRCG